MSDYRWELLELSIVAIPANPEATFEMRQLAAKKNVAFNANGKAANSGLTSNTNGKQTEIEYENRSDLWNWGAAWACLLRARG